MRRLLLGLLVVALAAQPARAQLSVYDPANTARNTISAIYQEYLLQTEQAQHEIRRQYFRLSRAIGTA